MASFCRQRAGGCCGTESNPLSPPRHAESSSTCARSSATITSSSKPTKCTTRSVIATHACSAVVVSITSGEPPFSINRHTMLEKMTHKVFENFFWKFEKLYIRNNHPSTVFFYLSMSLGTTPSSKFNPLPPHLVFQGSASLGICL